MLRNQMILSLISIQLRINILTGFQKVLERWDRQKFRKNTLLIINNKKKITHYKIHKHLQKDMTILIPESLKTHHQGDPTVVTWPLLEFRGRQIHIKLKARWRCPINRTLLRRIVEGMTKDTQKTIEWHNNKVTLTNFTPKINKQW